MSKQKVLTLAEARAALVDAQAAYDRAARPLTATIERRQRIVDALASGDTDPDDLAALKHDGLKAALEAEAAQGQLKGFEAKLAAALIAYIASARAETSSQIKALDAERKQARADIDNARQRQTRAAQRVTGVAMLDGRLQGYAEAVQKDTSKAAALVEHAIAAATGL